MPEFIIVRDVPGVESLNNRDIKADVMNSNSALAKLASDIHWQHQPRKNTLRLNRQK